MQKHSVKTLSILCLFFLLALQTQAQKSPFHMFFEYGKFGGENAPTDRQNNHFISAGIKIHKWKEEKPFLFE